MESGGWGELDELDPTPCPPPKAERLRLEILLCLELHKR